jgi:hypothetical protein
MQQVCPSPLRLIQQTRRDLLHFIDRERAIHVHRRLIRLMPQKVLNPLGTEAFRFQKTGNRVTKEMRIQMGEARIGIGHASFRAEGGDNVVGQSWSHDTVAIAEKDWSGFPAADEDQHVAEVLVVDERDDTGFATFPLADHDPFAVGVEVADIEVDEFTAPHAQPGPGVAKVKILDK